MTAKQADWEAIERPCLADRATAGEEWFLIYPPNFPL